MSFESFIHIAGSAIFGEERIRYWRYKRARRIAEHYGYEIYKPQMIWQQDAAFLAVKKSIRNQGIVGIPNDRCYMLFELARKCRKIPGDIAECGVRFGKSSLFLLHGFGTESDRRFEAFDSFQGLSKPSASDQDFKGNTSWTKGELQAAEDVFLRNVSDFKGRVTSHKGWIPSRFADVEAQKFVFLHVDVDLYDPTRESLEFFYPRMNVNGVIVCDDYGSAYCPGAKRAVDEFFADKGEEVLSLPTGQAIIFKSANPK